MMLIGKPKKTILMHKGRSAGREVLKKEAHRPNQAKLSDAKDLWGLQKTAVPLEPNTFSRCREKLE